MTTEAAWPTAARFFRSPVPREGRALSRAAPSSERVLALWLLAKAVRRKPVSAERASRHRRVDIGASLPEDS